MRRCTRLIVVGWHQVKRSLSHVVAMVAIVAVFVGSSLQWADLVQQPAEAAASGCQLAQVAFCDTFDAPAANASGTRSGDLDAVVWGVSHATSDDNVTQNSNYRWNASSRIFGPGWTGLRAWNDDAQQVMVS